MDELIMLYLLEQPRSVSDMIRELTEKSLSDDAEERSEQIPRIAGNWFKKETGYLWRLREQGVIQDSGRRYVLNKDWLVDTLFDQLAIPDRFPDYGERGDVAALEPAYQDLLSEEYDFGGFRRRVKRVLFSGDVMSQVFAFDRWRDVVLAPCEADHRICTYQPRCGFWPAVHLMFLSAVLASRKEVLTERMGGRNQYFTWKNRRTHLTDVEERLVDKVVRQQFGDASTEYDGAYSDTDAQRVAAAFGDAGVDTGRDQFLTVAADLYALYLNDGANLFEQQAKHGNDVHIFYNLLEKGWLVATRNVDRDPSTGNYTVPLGQMHAYLDDLVTLMVADTDR